MLNSCIVNSQLKLLGLSGNSVTIQAIQSRFAQIKQLFKENHTDPVFISAKAAYSYLKANYVPAKDYVDGIPVYEITLRLSDIYCNRTFFINEVEFTASISCFSRFVRYSNCIILYSVISDMGFKYNELDLLYTLDIDMLTAITGSNADVMFLNKTLLNVSIPPLSNNDTVITVYNNGLSNGHTTGNLYIKLNISAPVLNPAQLLALQKFISNNIR